MASHQLAIAKASVTAALLRPDLTSLSRQEIERGFSSLNTVILQCSTPNIQKCKRWILGNITHSAARFTALGKYLVILTSTLIESPGIHPSGKPSPKRKCLHILYLLNDILYHANVHIKDASVAGKIQPYLVALFSAAASFKNCPKHDRKIQYLLDIWTEHAYYSTDYIAKLREAVRTSSASNNLFQNSEQSVGESSKTHSKALPFVMPAMHGDLSTPWYDLPAANLMPHIVPNSTRPIRPDLVKPLQFVAGPADEKIANAVKELLSAVDEMYEESKEDNQEVLWDVDELGQQIHLDEITGEVIQGEGYYGWSKEFCEKMRLKRRGGGQSKHQNDGRSRSASLTPSESGSENIRPFKRGRRRSNTDSSQSNSRSLSRSESPNERYAARFQSKPELDPRSNDVPRLLPEPSQPLYSHQHMPFPRAPHSGPPHFANPIGPSFAPSGMIPPPPPHGYNGTWPPIPQPFPQPIPQPMPYGRSNESWPQVSQYNGAPPHWQPNSAPWGRNVIHQQYPGDGRGAWNGSPQPYQNQHQHQQNQGYGHGPNRGRGNFRGRGRG